MLKRISLCLFLLVSTGLLFGQSADVSGYVKDQTGASVPKASVELRNQSTGIRQSTVTNKDGVYNISNLKPGTYVATVQAQGFRTLTRESIVLNVADRVSMDFSLKVGSTSETVNVSSEAPMVDTDPSVSTVVDQRFVENLPLNGRTFQSLISLTPGAVRTTGAGQFSFNGQRDTSNYFTVDGVAANTGIGLDSAGLANGGGYYSGPSAAGAPTISAIGTTSSLLSIDAMQEFKVQTSTYSAEYGRSPGGQIQITSRSGSNRLSGTAYDYLRNDVFDSFDAYSKYLNSRLIASNQTSSLLKKPPLRQNDFGFTLGGPVVIPGLYNGKDRTFFFVSYEGVRLRQPNSGIVDVPSAAFRSNPAGFSPSLAPYVALAPMPNGVDPNNGNAPAYVSSFSNPSSTNATSIRIDHRINDKLNLFVRYAYSPSYSAVRTSYAVNNLQTNSYDQHLVTVGANSALTPHLANELRFNWTKNEGSSVYTLDNYGGAAVPTSTQMEQMFPSKYGASAANSTFSFGLYPPDNWYEAFELGTIAVNTQRQMNLVDNLSWAVGKHNLTFGADWRFLYPIAAPNYYNALMAYYLPSDMQSGNPSLAIIQQQDKVVVHQFQTSLYAQDSWKLTSRLTLDYGLRWEIDPAPKSANGQPLYGVANVIDFNNATLAPAGAPLYPTDWHALAPRVGFSYEVRNTPGWETVVRGGYGIFYDTGAGGALNATGAYPHTRAYEAGTFFGSQLDWFNTPLAPPPAITTVQPPYTNQNIIGYAPGYTLPRTHEWNVSIEQALGSQQSLTLSYVGSIGRNLVRFSRFQGNTPRYSYLDVYSSVDTSDYNAFEAKFMRRLSHGLQALASYTWSKSFDTSSSDSNQSTSPAFVNLQGERGLSSFDVRHNFSMSLSYDIPTAPVGFQPLRFLLQNWSIDTIYQARTGMPLTVTMSSANVLGAAIRPDIVPGQSVWISSPTAFSGKVINPAAFSYAFLSNGSGRVQGNEPRGYVPGFGLSQLDFTIRRQFKLSERFGLQWRLDTFNLLNQTNYGAPRTSLGSYSSTGHFSKGYQFGQVTSILSSSFGAGALYAPGGSRSMQMALKLTF